MASVSIGRSLVLAGCAMTLAACDGPPVDKVPLPEPQQSATASTADPVLEAAPSLVQTPDLDDAALDDHADPERLLRYYAAAVRAGAWEAAAKAWSTDSHVTAQTLQLAYGRGKDAALLVFGKGDREGAAGTIFHVAPIVVDFPNDSMDERRGTIVLRRANDVPGASAEQLDWRIERSDVLEQPAR